MFDKSSGLAARSIVIRLKSLETQDTVVARIRLDGRVFDLFFPRSEMKKKDILIKILEMAGLNENPNRGG